MRSRGVAVSSSAPIAGITDPDIKAAFEGVQRQLKELQDQINGNSHAYGSQKDSVPTALKSNDVVCTLTASGVGIGLHNGKTVTPVSLKKLSGALSDLPVGTLQLSALAGTITDTQHGARGNGTLHTIVTTSVNGFMSAADKTTLVDITSSGTAATALNATKYSVNGTQVVTARQAGVTAAIPGRAATVTYGAVEQTMLQEAHNMARTVAAACRVHGLFT